MEETSDLLRNLKATESKILLEEFNAHVENDTGVWKVVIG